MKVTEIEPASKTRYQIYVDGQFAFELYKGELSRYHITVGCELTKEVYETIRRDVVLKRAKLRAMHLLNDMGRTEAQLRAKLEQSGYPDDIVEETMAYVKSFGYVNDLKYAQNFIESRKDRKSQKEIYAALSGKRIAMEDIDRAMEECYDREDSETAIREIIRKKRFDPETADYTERQKMAGYLVRKGFRYEDVRRVLLP